MNIDPATLDAKAVADYAPRRTKRRRRLPDGDHPDDDRRRLTRLDPAGAVRRDPVRHRAVAGRRAGKPVLDLLERALGPVVFKLVGILMRARRSARSARWPSPSANMASAPRQPRRAGRDLLPHLAALRARRARRVARLQRLLDPAADPLSQGRTAARARHLLVGSRAAQPDGEDGSAPAAPSSVVGLVVPTGYSFNLDGTNIYMTLAALFIAQATGVST
jgi:aerobic C4-dicarboxylate transport protein